MKKAKLKKIISNYAKNPIQAHQQYSLQIKEKVNIKKTAFNLKWHQLRCSLALRKINPLLFRLFWQYLFTSEKTWTVKNILPPAIISKQKVDIIIPWYGDQNIFKLIETIFQHQDEYLGNVFVINDAYPDKKLSHQVLEFCLKYQPNNLFYLLNKKNLGFVGTVNLGMKKASNDFILLNSDTLPQKNWLKYILQVAYSHEKIATVTPLSNNATIFSWPQINQVNDYQSAAIQAQRLSRFLPTDYFEVPTGHGFCLFIKQAIYQKFGEFDAATYGMGYGEENDFCRRVAQAGYLNVSATRAFVAHLQSQSFGSEKREALCRVNHQKLIARYPDYDQLVRDFINQNPLVEAQAMYQDLINDSDTYQGEFILTILHSHIFFGLGGVEVSTQKMITHLINKHPQDKQLIYFFDQKRQIYQLLIIIKGKITHKISFVQKEPLMIISWIIKLFKLKLVICEHLIYHHPNYLDYFKNAKINFIWFIHDFYHLCQIPDLIVDGQAQALNRGDDFWNQAYQKNKLIKYTHQQWRAMNLNFFTNNYAQAIIFNSEFLLEQYCEALKIKKKSNFYVSYPDLEREI